MQPIPITRAEYNAKFGVTPTESQAPQQPTQSSKPIPITRAEYQAKFGQLPASMTKPIGEQPQEQGLPGQLSQRATDVGGAISDTLTGKVNPVSGVLRGVGGVAGGLTDVVGAGLEKIPGVKQVTGLIGKGIGKLAETGAGKATISGISSFAEKHPELAADIKAVGNIAGAATMVGGGGVAKKFVQGGVKKAMGKNVLKEIVSDIAPEVSAKAGAKTIAKQGLIKTPITGTIKTVASKAEQNVAQIIADNVPGFSKLGTFAEKVNLTRKTAYDIADKLKQKVIKEGKNIIYPFKELESKMVALEPSISIKADTVLQRQFNLAREAALKIAKDKGGTIDSLLDSRKAFDDLVAKQFPNLYDKANAPMRDAITQMRRTMNKFIEEKLPKGTGYTDSLNVQTNLFNAIENMSPKALNEVGTSRFSRYAAKHPLASGLIKKATTAGIYTGVGGAGYGMYKGLTD